MFTEEQAFILLQRRILKDRGIDCGQYKERYLKRRIATRLRATGAKDYLEYANILKKNPDEYEFLVAALTINVTEFFRDHDVYQKLLTTIVPDLLERKEATKSNSLRVWSAGCASGEEAYSVAMIIYQVLGEGFGGWNVRILGTDIDEKSLAAARRGVYSQVKVLEGMDQSRFFSEIPNDGE
ncbi:MAG: protein-glutamate O-methyltransferase CheR, partial [Actinomycetota bacterium]|nr:protein-glutamate O-methyltransferase CheR [Actinomycetota bacterium]